MIELNKIYNSDFRDMIKDIPENSLIITDPPYNMGVKYGNFKDSELTIDYISLFYQFFGNKSVFIHYPEDTIRYICRALGTPNEVVSWVYNSNLPRQHRLITWFGCYPNLSKITQPYKNMEDSRIKKLVEKGSSGVPIYDWWNIEQVKNVSKEKEQYMNQIPEEVIGNIIKTTANRSDVIVDPFCGSGTTCAVAKKLGYDFIGIDQNEEAVEIANNRLQKILI